MIEKTQIYNPEGSKIRFFAYIVALYFLLAPFEDMLNLGFGTILKYLALFLGILIIFPLITGEIKINLNDPLIVLPFLLITISWCSMLWSANLDATIARNVAYTLLPMLFIIIKIYNFRNKEIELIKIAIALSMLFLICYVLLNYREFMWSSYGRFTLNEENDPNNLAAHIIMPLFLIVIFLINNNNIIIKIISTIFIIFGIFVLLLTGSRGGMFSVIIGLSYLTLININRNNTKFFIILFLGGIIAFYFINKYLPQDLIQRLFTIESYQSDTERYTTRSGVWKSIYTLVFPIMPFLGYGSGVAQYVLADIYGYLKGVHNTYLNMVLEYGFLALPIFLFFIYRVYKYLAFNKKINYISLLIAMLVIIFFLDSYAKKFLWNILMFLIIITNEELYYPLSRTTGYNTREAIK